MRGNHFLVVIAVFILCVGLNGQQVTPRILLNSKIDEHQLVQLGGNSRPEAAPANDAGLVADDFPMRHLTLQLRRSAEQQAALDNFTADLQNTHSGNVSGSHHRTSQW
jgi:hypothetical protein